MADANIPSRPHPGGWSEALAALPLERPPADAWARLSERLPQATAPAGPAPRAATRARPRLRSGLAVAASVAFALPMAWWLGTSPQAPTRAPTAVIAATPTSTPTPTSAPTSTGIDPVAATAAAEVDRGAPTPSASATLPAADGNDAAARRRDGRAIASQFAPTRAGDPAPVARAASDASPAVSTKTPIPYPVAATSTPATSDGTMPALSEASRLDGLRRESARLEALVAYARDERMTSAPVAVMSASIDDRIRLIDAALMQSGLDEALRASLWTERVDALQELASLEGTQRWMAAHGASLDAVAHVD